MIGTERQYAEGAGSSSVFHLKNKPTRNAETAFLDATEPAHKTPSNSEARTRI
jgi:hypothetical protein